MKHNIFKIRKLGEPTEGREPSEIEGSAKKTTEIDSLKASIQQTNDKMVQLMGLFETFMKTSIQQQGTTCKPTQIILSPQVERQVRDRYVHLPLPSIESLSKEQAQKWITEVCAATFSTSFHYYITEQLTFEQTKVFCSENILRNMLLLTERFKLTDKEIQNISKHIGQKVLEYLQKKYPLTQTNDVNKALEREVQETNHLDLLTNDFLYSAGIMFKYSPDGNYNDMIMKVINKAIEIAQSPSLFANFSEEKKKNREEETNYNDFQIFMSDLFENVYDEEWMVGSKAKAERIDSDATHLAKKINSESHREKYQDKVKAYTNYLVGRKISENTLPYTETEINSKNLVIKSPAILRILTKWCEQLWQKFDNETYFTERTESIQLQNPEIINPFFKWMKTAMDKLAADEKKNILIFKAELERNSYTQEAEFLLKHLEDDKITSIPKYEKATGKFATQMVKNLHSYITLYLNRLIHGLLKIAKDFFDKQVDKSWDDWQYPANLITFKIGDLLRCKMSSKEKEIVKVFKQIKQISNTNPKKLKIVRIKNRLKQGTNDILINIKFNNLIICQIQLEVINKSKSKFIQCSNSFSHYIYEMKRSIFGPISQLCNIWNNFEARASQYESLINQSIVQQIVQQGCINSETPHNFMKFDLPFQCSSCYKLYYHNNYIIPNKKCSNCSKYKCVKCQINNMEEEELKKLIFPEKKNKKLSERCKRHPGKTIPAVGVCVKIESTIVNCQIFKFTKSEGKAWLLGKKEDTIYNINPIKKPKDTEEFVEKYCIFQITYESSSFINITDKMVQNFAMEEYVKDSYKQEKQVLILTQIRFTVPQMIELMKVDGGYQRNKRKIRRLQFASNYINDISYFSCYQNLTTINLDYNYFENMLEVCKFKSLQKLQMRENSTLTVFNEEVCQLEKLEEIKITNCKITNLPEKIGNLTLLNTIKMQKNSLKTLPDSICNITNLKEMNFMLNSLTNLPQNIGNLINLKKLLLKKNQLETLPLSIGRLEGLQILDLSKNMLKELPNNLMYLSKLQTLRLQQNKLQAFPSTLLANESLKVLSVHKNRLKALPDSFDGCKNLQELTLYDNELEQLPKTLGECVYLTELSLYHNKIKEIPSWFSNFKRLSSEINFRKNCLKQIPAYIFELETVAKLILQNNEIESIPNSICKLEDLTTLKLQNNKIGGLVPELASLKHLQLLEVQFNEVSHIPLYIKQIPCFKKNISTWGGSFKSNKVTSFQSSMLFDLMETKIQFNFNKINEIPMELINNKEKITQLILTDNQIKEIPREIKLFISMKLLYLKNNLIETVPKELEELKQIQNNSLSIEGNPIKINQCYEFCMKYGNYATRGELKEGNELKVTQVNQNEGENDDSSSQG